MQNYILKDFENLIKITWFLLVAKSKISLIFTSDST